jgi:hypothetical protein
LDGAAERLNLMFDGWTERWDNSSPLTVPGAWRSQRYSLIKPDGVVPLRRTMRVPGGPRRGQGFKGEPFRAYVGTLSRRAEKLIKSLSVDEDPPEFSDRRLMGGTLAAGTGLLAFIGVMIGIPIPWKLLIFTPGVIGAAMAGYGWARGAAERAGWLLYGRDAKTGAFMASPEASDKLWNAREKAASRGGIAFTVGLLGSFISGSWLLYGPPLASAWLSVLLNLPVQVHPPLWTYVAAFFGLALGSALLGYSWGAKRVVALSETAAELVGLDGTRKKGGA